jgi:hypothetical protein
MKRHSIYFTALFLSIIFLLIPITLQARQNLENQTDSSITNEVQNKIRSNLFYTVFDWVTVKTRDGAVTLNGYAHLPWDKAFFEKIAKEAEGVKSVTDKIKKVSGPDDLRYKAAEAIYSSPDFEKDAFMKDPPVHIIVISNRIILEGSVISPMEKSWADMLIHWHTDAFKVKNNLLIEKS